MAFHLFSPPQLPLILARSKNSPVLPRQIIAGREMSDWLGQASQDDDTLIHVHQDSMGEIQGALVLRRAYPRSHEVNVAWTIAADAARETLDGMMLEGLELAFSEPGVQRVSWDLIADEDLDLDPYRTYGFCTEGRFRDAYHDENIPRDVIRLGVLRNDWGVARPRLGLPHTEERRQPLRKPQHVIQVLTDAGSWIAPYVDELAQQWTSAGHVVQVANKVEHALPADFCFCLSFSRIISAEARQQYKHTLVVHESNLPDGRGWAPMTWQILEGKNRIPVTLLEAVDAVDAGPIYLQEWIDLDGTELNPEWRLLQARATQNLCLQWLQAYPAILNDARQQTGAGSVYPRRNPDDSKLDPSKTLVEQFDLLRVVDNQDYPAFFEMRGRVYEIGINPRDKAKK